MYLYIYINKSTIDIDLEKNTISGRRFGPPSPGHGQFMAGHQGGCLCLGLTG